MSAVAYVVTKDVRHLSSWTADRESIYDYAPSGRYRPICGGKVRGWRATFWPGSPYEDRKFAERAAAKPLCRRCAKTLERLNEAAQ